MRRHRWVLILPLFASAEAPTTTIEQYEEREEKCMKQLMRKNVVIGAVLILVLLCTGLVFAQKKPVQDISAKRHPNLAAAQRLTDQAFRKITAAQDANEFDLAGHAKHAKELLDQANEELKKAAEVSNVNHQ